MPDLHRPVVPVPPPVGPARRAGALGLVLLLSACAHGGPPEVPGTPAEKRLAVVRGTTPGLTVWPARPSADDAGSRAAPAAAPRTAAETVPARTADGTSTPSTWRRFLGGLTERLGPPTGRPLSEQKKLDAPDQGLPLPTTGPAGGR